MLLCSSVIIDIFIILLLPNLIIVVLIVSLYRVLSKIKRRRLSTRELYKAMTEIRSLQFGKTRAEVEWFPSEAGPNGEFYWICHLTWKKDDVQLRVTFSRNLSDRVMVAYATGDTEMPEYKFDDEHDPISEAPDCVRQILGVEAPAKT